MLSFGHISFVAVGAWAAGILSMAADEKPAIMPNLTGFLRDTTVGNVPSLAIAAGVGAVYALVVGLPLMRLSGLAAGIATFGVLEITHNVLRYWETIGPGLNTSRPCRRRPGVPGGYRRPDRRRRGVRLRTQPQRAEAPSDAPGRGSRPRSRRVDLPRAARRLRRLGRAGGPRRRAPDAPAPREQRSVYLDLTFITLAMLVIGGATSLWGAVVGAIAVSAVDSFLAEAENGVRVAGVTIDLPAGTRIVVVGALMALVLIVRPTGLTGGREFSLRRARARRLLTKLAP